MTTIPHVAPDAAQRHGRRFFLFSLVGVFNTGVDFAAYSAAIMLGVTPGLANILAFSTANPLSYLINGRVTFRASAGAAPLSVGGYAKFCTAHLFSLAISTSLVVWLAPLMGAFAAKLGAVALTVFINFFASTFFVFRPGEKGVSEAEFGDKDPAESAESP